MFLGSELERQTEPVALLPGVGGGCGAWMKVLCTRNPMWPSVEGVRGAPGQPLWGRSSVPPTPSPRGDGVPAP